MDLGRIFSYFQICAIVCVLAYVIKNYYICTPNCVNYNRKLIYGNEKNISTF